MLYEQLEEEVKECNQKGMEFWEIKNEVKGNISHYIIQDAELEENSYSIFLKVIESFDMPLDF